MFYRVDCYVICAGILLKIFNLYISLLDDVCMKPRLNNSFKIEKVDNIFFEAIRKKLVTKIFAERSACE